MKRFTFTSLALATGFAAVSLSSLAYGDASSFSGADQFGGANSAEIQRLLEDLAPLAKGSESGASKPIPTTSFGTPSAYGANSGQAYVGYAGSYDQNHSRRADGSIAFGGGFGNAVDSVGVEIDASLNGLSNNRGEHFGDSGSVGFKIHKIIPESNGLGVALGWANAADWGEAQDGEETVYVAATKGFALNPDGDNKLPVAFTLGTGTGAFRSHDDIKKGDNHASLFGSAGIVIIPELSFATSWTGSQLNAGFGISPFTLPLSMAVGYADVTDKSKDGRALNFNVGYMFSY